MNSSLHGGKENNLANCSGCHLNALPCVMEGAMAQSNSAQRKRGGGVQGLSLE